MAGAVDGSLSTQVIVDLADMKASDNPAGRLMTGNLGSCLAVAIYDPEVRVGGLLHFMLPDSSINRQKAMLNPFLFADTGIPLLFRRAYHLGAVKQRIICKLVGAANVMDPQQFFHIGLRNHLAACKILSDNHVNVHEEYVGGRMGMSMRITLDTGAIAVTLTNGEEFEL